MTEVISGPWRSQFDKLLRTTTRSLMIAAPFIKLTEAEHVTNLLLQRDVPSRLGVQVLTDFRADSIMASSLDIQALHLLAVRFAQSEIVSVPRLHAKVYVADERVAIVTSSNLTRSGLDSNIEYGVEISDQPIVDRVVSDMANYSRLGSKVPVDVLSELIPIEFELRRDFERVLASAGHDVRRRFDTQYRAATEALIATQVGSRSANAVFSEAILYVLADQPAATVQLHPRIQSLLPDLCDDNVELVINGERYGKRWKHQVRNAQQALKRAGLISFDRQRWLRVRQ